MDDAYLRRVGIELETKLDHDWDLNYLTKLKIRQISQRETKKKRDSNIFYDKNLHSGQNK